MVDEKPIPFVPALAVPAQGGGHRLALFPGVDKNQALFPPGVFKNISDSRVRVQRRFIGLSSNTGSASGTTRSSAA